LIAFNFFQKTGCEASAEKVFVSFFKKKNGFCFYYLNIHSSSSVMYYPLYKNGKKDPAFEINNTH